MKSPQELHDIAVQKIAGDLFTFPGAEFTPGFFHPAWITYTNVPARQMPVEHKWEGKIYPDLVIADTARGNVPVVIGEVETRESLNLEESIQMKWRPDMDECAILYVFVPEGCGRDAAVMVLDARVIFPTALFTYGFDDAGNLRLTPV
ncbi:MAG: hypothetical protein HYX96_04350 [Chloroflexi bacterium]|nr:hypothetical protein [Chloroflexota bacterium]